LQRGKVFYDAGLARFSIPDAKRIPVIMKGAATVTETNTSRYNGGATNRPRKWHGQVRELVIVVDDGFGWRVVVLVVAVIAFWVRAVANKWTLLTGDADDAYRSGCRRLDTRKAARGQRSSATQAGAHGADHCKVGKKERKDV